MKKKFPIYGYFVKWGGGHFLQLLERIKHGIFPFYYFFLGVLTIGSSLSYVIFPKFGWCLQEVPAFIVSATALVQLWTEERTRLALALLPFAAHYCNRSFIFPLSVKQGTDHSSSLSPSNKVQIIHLPPLRSMNDLYLV